MGQPSPFDLPLTTPDPSGAAHRAEGAPQDHIQAPVVTDGVQCARWALPLRLHPRESLSLGEQLMDWLETAPAGLILQFNVSYFADRDLATLSIALEGARPEQGPDSFQDCALDLDTMLSMARGGPMERGRSARPQGSWPAGLRILLHRDARRWTGEWESPEVPPLQFLCLSQLLSVLKHQGRSLCVSLTVQREDPAQLRRALQWCEHQLKLERSRSEASLRSWSRKQLHGLLRWYQDPMTRPLRSRLVLLSHAHPSPLTRQLVRRVYTGLSETELGWEQLSADQCQEILVSPGQALRCPTLGQSDGPLMERLRESTPLSDLGQVLQGIEQLLWKS